MACPLKGGGSLAQGEKGQMQRVWLANKILYRNLIFLKAVL
jgi:hypothetical protein